MAVRAIRNGSPETPSMVLETVPCEQKADLGADEAVTSCALALQLPRLRWSKSYEPLESKKVLNELNKQLKELGAKDPSGIYVELTRCAFSCETASMKPAVPGAERDGKSGGGPSFKHMKA